MSEYKLIDVVSFVKGKKRDERSVNRLVKSQKLVFGVTESTSICLELPASKFLQFTYRLILLRWQRFSFWIYTP